MQIATKPRAGGARIAGRTFAGAALVLGSALSLPSTPAQAAGLNYQVTNYDNDGTHGVYLRSSSNVNDVTRNASHYVTYGTTVQLVCAEWGSAVGPKANTAWDYVKVLTGPNTGKYGHLNEHWLNTPVSTNQHVSGEPSCTTSPTTAAQKAVNWAVAHNGQSFDSGYCLLFVEQAYAAGGVNIGTGGTAAKYWSADPKGYTRHTSTSPAVGALVFWGATASNSAGHVGIYLGNDQVISTSSWPEKSTGTTVHEWSLTGRNAEGYPYLGWMSPS
jgi:cell wall-associated NlpC family hydrolase